MSDIEKAYQATPAATLEQQIMDPNFPKNEREWWAAARIEQLEAALRGIKWRSADRDNMEFAATITYLQMDAIRAALGEERT